MTRKAKLHCFEALMETEIRRPVYWSNKATAITADVPSEAELTPGL